MKQQNDEVVVPTTAEDSAAQAVSPPNAPDPIWASRRAWLVGFGLGGLAGWLVSYMQRDPFRGQPTYSSQPIDVIQTPSVVEFDFYIRKAQLYDIVLEVFAKELMENVPDSVIHPKDEARFVFRIDRIQTNVEPGRTIVKAEEKTGRLKPRSGFAFSTLEVWPEEGWAAISLILGITSLREYRRYPTGMTFWLISRTLEIGHYRLRCTCLNPLPSLQGRWVRIAIKNALYAK